jgi:RNA polymerase sigma-32 factor
MARVPSIAPDMVLAAAKAPYLERDHETELAERWRQNGDQQALDTLITSHMRLVIAVASRFRHYGLPMSDLVQEGHVGLLEAANRYDSTREVRFSTYAVWWIRASLQDYVLRNWSIVRGGTSSTQKALFFNLRKLKEKLTREERLSDVQMQERIAKSLHVSPGEVAAMDARLSGRDPTLNAALSPDDGDAERIDMLVDEAPLPDELVERSLDGAHWQRWLKSALQGLSDRERLVIRERRLRDEDDTATLERLAKRLGVSKERVRQIESAAMDKLKRALATKKGLRQAFS